MAANNDQNYIVGTLWTMKDSGKTSLTSEVFHRSIEEAIADYEQRFQSERDLVICKVLRVKTVIIDYDVAGVIEQSIGE
jgi:hypothetical protein